MATLVRETANARPRPDGTDMEFARECATKLHYNRLLRAVEYAPKKTLQEVLVELDIKPYSAKSVQNYKSMESTKVYLSRKNWPALIFDGVIFLLFACLVTFPTALLLQWLHPFELFGLSIGWYALIAFGLFVGGVVCECNLENYANRFRPEWTRTELSSYTKPVPEFALQTALDIKNKLPNAVFYVEELVIRKEVRDPFLIVQVENQSDGEEYLEVWNEPNFKHAKN